MAASRRRALLGLAALLAPGAGRAQAAWPSQPLKIVVPYPPGALTDVLGRLIGERLNSAFGQPVMVDNKAGAATSLAPPMSPSSRPTATRCCSPPSRRSA
jgi:tripartite-type tricarboxylate transporter receptor subunit TctC